MIEINLASLIGILFFTLVLLVFSVWIFYNYNEEKDLEELYHIHQCPYCTHIFKTASKKSIQTCPNCNSLLTIEKNTNNAET